MSEAPPNSTPETQAPVPTGPKTMSTKKAWMTLVYIALIAAVAILAYSYKANQKEEASKLLQDAITGSETAANQDQVKLVKAALDAIKNKIIAATPHDQKLANSNILQVESFRSQAEMKVMVTDIKAASAEIKALQSNYFETIRLEVEIAVNNAPGEQEWKDGFKKGFLTSYNNERAVTLTNSKFDATVRLYDEIAKFYEFLLANFSKYEIDYDDTGNLNIFFDDEASLDKYGELTASIGVLAQEFNKTQADLEAYLNETTSGYGVSSQDVIDYFAK